MYGWLGNCGLCSFLCPFFRVLCLLKCTTVDSPCYVAANRRHRVNSCSLCLLAVRSLSLKSSPVDSSLLRLSVLWPWVVGVFRGGNVTYIGSSGAGPGSVCRGSVWSLHWHHLASITYSERHRAQSLFTDELFPTLGNAKPFFPYTPSSSCSQQQLICGVSCWCSVEAGQVEAALS